MKVIFKTLSLFLVAALLITAFGCGREKDDAKDETEMNFTKNADGYYQISASEAHDIMVRESGYVILDVRTESEFNEAHIPDAILLPDYEITERAAELLPDRDRKILVYCRSGRRSKNAAAELAAMGYTNIWEFGGIIDWPYDVVTDGENPQAN